jgi:hypothetical protein
MIAVIAAVAVARGKHKSDVHHVRDSNEEAA